MAGKYEGQRLKHPSRLNPGKHNLQTNPPLVAPQMVITYGPGDVVERNRATAYRLDVFTRGRLAVASSQLEI